jgi:threonine/homoserine/homoserine lactone efflux protein
VAVEALLLGLTIGFAAGISPGPLLFLTITSSLRSGARAGVLVALAPLLTDAVIVGLVLLVLDRLPGWTLALLGVLGGLFVVWTGVQTIREARTATLAAAREGDPSGAAEALRRGALVNFLSPHPWITWATALGPLTVSTWRDSPANGLALVVGFYVLLVGAKVAIALLVGRARRRLSDRGYRRSLLVAGALLLVAGVALVIEFAPQLT